MTKPILAVGDFCTITDSGMAEHGIKKGDVVYLAGDTILPYDEKDPYNLRRLFICGVVEDGHIKGEGGVIIDPKRLKQVSKAKQEKLDAIREEDWGDKEEVH